MESKTMILQNFDVKSLVDKGVRASKKLCNFFIESEGS